jgi:HAE1 family hydrophobic/amphiphilic exporter-1
MMVAAFIVLGILAYFKLPAELNPKVDFQAITITTTYTGTNPQEMETLITKPIEDAISGVSGIKQITSTSAQGVSVVNIQFYFGSDLDSAAADVIQKIDAIRKILPTDADSPSVLKADTSSQPVIYYSMMSDTRSPRDLRSLATQFVQPLIAQAPSVGNVTIAGGDVREIRVAARPDRLQAYGITISQLATALRNANVNASTGYIQRGDQFFNVRLLGEFTNIDEIKKLRLTVNGTSFYVSDVADVIDTRQEKTSYSSVNGKSAVTFVVQKTSDGNTIEAADGVRKQVAKLKNVLPPDIHFVEVIDLSKIVRSNLEDVNISLFLGALMAVLVVYVFLHNIRGTLIVAIAIPVSIIGTFLPISMLGYSLNSMTLLGLSLAVGILVDDSIVVLENINRHLAMGEEPVVAALNGRGEIALAAITLTSVDLVVFLPIAFMGGIVGEFFRSFGMTVAIATLFSLFVSFTLTPMLASRWYKKGESQEYKGAFAAWFDRGFGKFENFYQATLRAVLKHPYIAVAIGNVLLIASVIFIAPGLGFRFAPLQDQNQVAITIEAPAGSSLSYTKGVTDQISKIIRSTPDLDRDVKYVFVDLGHSSSGGTGQGFTGTQYANISLQLYDKQSILDRMRRSKEHLRPRSDVDVAAEVRKVTANVIAKVTVSEVSGFGGGGAGIQIRLTGSDFAQILAAAEKVKAIVAANPGVVSPDISYKNSQPEVQIRIDRTKAPEFGLSLDGISSAVAASMQGDISSKYRDPGDGQQYDIRIQLPGLDRADPAQVGNIVVGYQNGAAIRLSQVAQIQVGAGPVKIDRLDRQRQVTVTGYLKPGFQVGNVSAQIMPKVNKLDLGSVTVSQGGEAQSMADEGVYMATAVLLGIVLAYMLMAALFNNIVYPLSIMLSLPQAWVGAMVALLVTHQPFSLIAVIGIVMLDGIVQKNAILLVDYTNTLRSRGYKRIDAILEAAPVRLRPIMMTTLAIIVTSLPTAMSLGRGSGFRQSLGIVIIGGSSLSLFLTLLIVPCGYIMWDDIGQWFGKISQRMREGNKARPSFEDYHNGTGNGTSIVAASSNGKNGRSDLLEVDAQADPEDDGMKV